MSRADREVQSHCQEQARQRWVGASTLLADLCSHSDTLTSPRVSPLMWTKPQLTTTLPDNPRFSSAGTSGSNLLLTTASCIIFLHVLLIFAVQLASWLASCLRSASELDSVMEFGLSGAMQLASSSRAGRRPVCDQVRTISTCRDSSNLSATGRKPGLQPASELDSVIEFGLF